MFLEDYSIHSKNQRDYYNKTAQYYDSWHVEIDSAKIVDAWNFKNLSNFLGNKKVERSLELGCGTGRLANNLFSISREVYGVDQSSEVLAIAQRKYPQLKLTCAEVIKLPYQSDFFDLVLINGSLHHFFAVEKTLAEAYRVLKPGGVFVLLGEPSKQFMKFYNPFFYFWLADRVIAKFISFFKKPITNSQLIEPEAEAYKPAKLKKQLLAAGFDVKLFYTYDYFHRTENKFLLKFYSCYLDWENRVLAKIFKNLGMAIQVMARKK